MGRTDVFPEKGREASATQVFSAVFRFFRNVLAAEKRRPAASLVAASHWLPPLASASRRSIGETTQLKKAQHDHLS